MSINLGSAHGEIKITADGVARTASSVANSLRNIERSSNGVAPALDKVSSAAEKIGAATGKGTAQAASSLDKLRESARGAGDAFDEITTGAGVGGAAIAAGIGLAVSEASKLESAVAQISTIKPELDTRQVSAALSQMSTQVAQSQTQLAEGLYNIFSSVEVSQADGLKLTEQFAKGAVAARTDAETFGGAILGVMNAYKLEVSDAGHVSDVFFQTVNKGVVSSEELAGNLGNVTQNAKSAGVGFDTLGALIAGVTKEGGNASQNINNLSNVLQKIVTADVQDQLKGLGIATVDAQGNLRDIIPVLTDLDKKLKTLSEADRAKTLQSLFPDAQARTGVVTLLSQLDFITATAKENAAAVGTTEAAYAKMGATAAAQAALLKNTLVATLTEIGTIALPGLNAAAGQLKNLVSAFAGLPDGMKQTAVYSAEAAAGLLLLGSGAAKAYQTVVSLAPAVRAVATALPILASGIGSAAVAAAPLIVALIAIEAAMRKVTGAGIVENAKSIAQYGDVLGGARDKANDFAKANENLPAITDKIASLRVQLGLLADQQRKMDNANPVDQFYDLLSGDQTKRNFDRNDIQKQIDLLEGYKHALDEKKAAEIAAANPVLGPPKPIFGPQLAEVQQYRDQLATIKAAQEQVRNGTLVAPGAQPNAGAAQFEQNANPDIMASTNEQLRAQANAATMAQTALDAYQQSINAAAAANSAASSAISGQIGPMTAALDALNQKRAAGLPLSYAEQQLYGQLPGSIGQATNAYTDLTIQAGRYQVLNQQLAAQSGTQNTAFSGISSQIDTMIGRYNALTGAIIAAKSEMSAIGQVNSELSSEYSLLGDRIAALQEKAKTKSGLNGDEQTELHNLLAVQGQIGDEIGNNTAKQRELVLQQRQQTQEAKATALAIAATAATTQAAGKAAANTREDRRTAVGPDLPPPATFFKPAPVQVPVTVDPVSLAGIPGQIAGIDVPPVLVKVKADVQAAGAELGAKALAAFGGATAQQTINVSVNDQATAPITNIKSMLAAIAGGTYAPPVGIADNASAPLESIKGKLDTIGGTTATAQVAANDTATGTISGAQGVLNTFAGSSAQPPVGVTDNASGPLGGILTLLNEIAGRSINIVATVDTSAAHAAIAELRANMPSSPAKKGPFHKLPEWQSVFDSLKPAGDWAEQETERTVAALSNTLGAGIDGASKEAAELASAIAGAVSSSVEALTKLRTFRPPSQERATALRDSLRTIAAGFATDSAGSTEDSRKAAKEWADGIGAMMQAINAGIDALGKMRDFKRPADQAVKDFRDVSAFLVRVMLEVATSTDADMLDAGKKWAEAAGAIFASVGQGVEALTKLGTFRRPIDKAVTDFRDVSQFLVNVMQQVAADGDLGAAADGAAWAESAGSIFSSVSTGVEALTKLQDFARPTDQAVKSFRDVAQFLVNIMAQVAADMESDAMVAAGKYADDAGKIVSLLSNGVDALAKLDGFARPDDKAVQDFRDVSQFLVNLIAAVAAVSEPPVIAAAAQYAESAGKIVGFVKTGADALTALNDFARPTDDAIQSFADAAEHAVYLIGQSAALFDDKVLAKAAQYAESAGKVVALIGSGTKALHELATGEFVAPTGDQMQRFADSTLQAVQAIAAAAANIDTKALAAAAQYADGAGKVVALVGNGVEGFNGLAEFTAPSVEQINRWKAAVSATVIAIAQASREIDQDAVKAAGTYADGAGKAVGLLGASVSAFKGLDKDFVAPSAQAIDAVVAVTKYGVDQLIGISGLYGKPQLDQLATFADAASKGYGALRAAADAAKSLEDKDRVKPVDALNGLLGDFNAGLTPLLALAATSRQYKTLGTEFAQNIAAAYAALGGALPGFNPAQAALTADVTVAGAASQTVVVHQHEPQVVRLEFLGENGAWIARSLTVDGSARAQTATILAGEIGAALQQRAPA